VVVATTSGTYQVRRRQGATDDVTSRAVDALRLKA
jgi:hypothetical protein